MCAGPWVGLGAAVTSFVPGDVVFGVTNARFTGGYAQYAAASASMLAIKPTSLSVIAAASVPVVAATAEQMLFDDAQLHGGDTAFVHGGAGNVGAYAVNSRVTRASAWRRVRTRKTPPMCLASERNG
jgi:NADPH:quinone reductase-like Zn-dependent oxidoreductase